MYIYIYKLTSKCHSQTTPFPRSEDNQGQEEAFHLELYCPLSNCSGAE